MPGEFHRKVNDFVELGNPVKMVFFVGEPGIPAESDQYVYIGYIKNIEDDLLTFKHIKTEADRMQISEEVLNLNFISIWSIAILYDGFDPSTTIVCPHCSGTINLLSVSNEAYT